MLVVCNRYHYYTSYILLDISLNLYLWIQYLWDFLSYFSTLKNNIVGETLRVICLVPVAVDNVRWMIGTGNPLDTDHLHVRLQAGDSVMQL